MSEIENRRDRPVDEVLAEVLKPGQDIVIGQSWGTPRTLLDALPRHLDRLAGSRIFLGMLVGDLPRLPGARIETFFPSGPLGSAEGLRTHSATYRRRSLFEVSSRLRDGSSPVDVVLAQVSPQRDGGHSLGVSVDYVHAAASRAGAVVAETGSGVPWTGTASTVDPARMLLVDTEAEPPVLRRESSDRDRVIAAHIATRIPDGATLQLGMASWTDPLAELLRDRRGLRVHSGLVSDWAVTLDRAGATDPAHQMVATGAGGTAEFYSWLDREQRVSLQPADFTHAPDTLAALPLLRSVNSVLEVDLFGNVNSEIGHGGRCGGVAGLHDFAVAAARNRDALSIIALPATSRGESRIVARVPDAAISVPPGSVDLVITEYGVADLRGLCAAEQVQAMISVAAPEHRAALARAGR